VITGTPGVGKSSVSRLLASRIKADLISVGDLVKKERLYIGVDKKRETLIADLEKVSESVEKIIAASCRDVIIEGHYAADVVTPEEVYLVIVLRRDPQELKSILKKRNYAEEKIRENLAAEILDVCLYDAVSRCGIEKICEFDVTHRKVEEVVEDILPVLDGKKERKVGIVDWLGKLNSEGKLEEYLKDF